MVVIVCCYGVRITNNQNILSYVNGGSAITRTTKDITVAQLKELISVGCGWC